MNTLQLEKFEGVAKVLRVIMKVLWIVLLVCSGLAAIASVASLFIPSDIISNLLDFVERENFAMDIAINGTAINLIDYFPSSQTLKHLLTIGLVSLIFVSAFSAYILRQLEIVLQNVVNKQPFADEAIFSLKKLSVAIIAGTFVSSGAHQVLKINLANNISDKIMADALLGNVDLSLPMIFVGLLIFLLAKIFEYGKALQTEVDELI